eukprot:CAMPEP_0204907164 /NCGR_PEP_ID=MMETSP1397-20131031/6366_1 /ASSEMBLY_ACC=CAM_ASM_000891 /TAXON_ID=49980 /ORGANISM="Climacostomum Climacostomum virens, Strain Stock W-24" /LENGTH=77 /DNA_ID=CAMNT_0052076207 /DNA_START=1337 /DNA_END=1570 /DNA_ORIENTATION=+
MDIALTSSAEADVGLVAQGDNVVDDLRVVRAPAKLLENCTIPLRLFVGDEFDSLVFQLDAVGERLHAQLATEGLPAV